MKVNTLNYKYYSKIQGKYNVIKSVDGKITYFGRYDTEKEARERVAFLKKHNWDTAYTKQPYHEIQKYDVHKHIRKGYFISKKTKNKTYYEGIYATRNEAKKRIQQLKRRSKMINSTTPIKTKVIPESIIIEKYGISEKYQVFRRENDGKIKKYAVFNNLEEAKKYVSYMYSQNWNINQEINTNTTSKNTNISNANLPRSQRKCIILIQQENKTHQYGVYDTWKEATRMVNFLSTIGIHGKIIEFYQVEGKNIRLPREVRYCTRIGSRYFITKRLYKQHYIFGRYDSKKETRKQLEILDTYNWDTKRSIQNQRIMQIDQLVDFVRPEKEDLNCRI